MSRFPFFYSFLNLFIKFFFCLVLDKVNTIIPPMPNEGIPPYVPMPPMFGLNCTGQHAAGWNRMASGEKKQDTSPQVGNQNQGKTVYRAGSFGTSNPQTRGSNPQTRGSNPSPKPNPKSPQMNVNNQNSNSPISPRGSGGSGDKIEAIKKAIRTVVMNELKPKIGKLKILVESATSTQNIQPFVGKIKEIKPDIESLKTILPPLEKISPPEKKPGEEALVSLKKLLGTILFEYELVLNITVDVSGVANPTDIMKIVGLVKNLKQKLATL